MAFCATLILYAIPAGILVGRRRIPVFGVLTWCAAVLRVLCGFLFGWGTSDGRGALAASALATLVAVLLAAAAVVALPEKQAVTRTRSPRSARISLTVEAAAGAALSAVLWAVWTLPVILARHFLPASAAGDFAAVQLMTGAVLFLTAGLATGFYPSIVRSEGTRALRIGLFATAGLSASATLVATVVGPLIVERVYGGRFSTSGVEFLTLGVSVTAVSSITYLFWATHALRRNVRVIGTAIVVAFLAELGVGNLWHTSPATLGAGPAISCALGMAVGLALMVWRRQSVVTLPVGTSPPPDAPVPARDGA